MPPASYLNAALEVEVPPPAAAAAAEASRESAREAAAEGAALLLLLPLRVVDVLARVVPLARVLVTEHLPARARGERGGSGGAETARACSAAAAARAGPGGTSYARAIFLNFSSHSSLSAAHLSGCHILASWWYAFLMARALAFRGTPSAL